MVFEDDARIRCGTKGLAPTYWNQPLTDLKGAGPRAIDGQFPTPLAVLKASALSNNLAAMAKFAAHNALVLAPHGKTTLSPELFHRQIEAGAWGMTVASAGQAMLCHQAGIDRIIIANQVVDPSGLETLARMQAGDPAIELYFLVDSRAGVEFAQQAFARHGTVAKVLIELGLPGGRCGCRSLDEVVDLARFIAGFDHVELCGIEGFEGLFFRDNTDLVDAFLEDLCLCLDTLEREGLLAQNGPVLFTAGGSAYFDLAAKALNSARHPRLLKVLRSGCYITHDDGFYAEQLPLAVSRGSAPCIPELKPALEIWTTVLSRPEPDLAIINAGKRDLGFDIDYPFVRQHYRQGLMASPTQFQGAKLFQLSDQHGFVRLPAGADVAVGDLLSLGVSHPCTTFDKWPVLLEVDEDYRVLGAISSYF